ncbi:putative U6 small nuclear RNA (adenine-(43)-N(6))-methyltransferase [[Candida] railenensis]|uniref:U6 small nuclear RNA (Adenine-(43)-N(6))-methyltransferase n=1 Tax=[Candida] railenensis TaxID=45579 RepID=A0A9P0QPF8_9ASCO|nr:putative U6 small nuclear RNA (adenine-(43)-N(6))-methyltransferase [[Candida] railenensis]
MDVNFSKLSEEFPHLKKHFKENGKYDFGREGAVYDISEVILKKVYDLNIHFDRTKLCPRIPNRLAYIKWCERLVHERCELNKDKAEGFISIDIGTGSSAIYPFLGVKHSKFASVFIGTDVDPHSIDHASSLVHANGLQDRIKLVTVSNSEEIINSSLIDSEDLDNHVVSITMCNPPFYSSHEDLLHHAQNKPDRTNVLTASESELIYSDGGEFGFVSKYVEQSLRIKDAAFNECWFTSQLGLKGTCDRLDEKMKELKFNKLVKAYIIEELIIRDMTFRPTTKRWVIAWTVNSKFHYPIPRLRIPNILLDLVYEKLNTFSYCTLYFDEYKTSFYLESEYPTWTRKLQRQIKFKRSDFLKNGSQKCIFKVAGDCVYWVYGEDNYSWETIKTYLLKIR